MENEALILIDKELQTDQNGPEVEDSTGGWSTFPFITGTLLGFTLATGAWVPNLVVYLIQEFNVNSVDAAQISNVVYGCLNLFPLIGAIIADSFFGLFPVISVASCASFLGMVLFVLTATLSSPTFQSCHTMSSICQTPKVLQFGVLYTAMTLATVGQGGTSFTLATMGANQFGRPKDQETFFNWYLFAQNAAYLVSATTIVYTEVNVSWKLGYGIAVAASLMGLTTFLSGKRFYRMGKPKGSPFANIARVIVTSFKKRKVELSSNSEDYHHEVDETTTTAVQTALPKTSFRFFNHAAMITKGDINPDGSNAKPWRLCTVKQVEDLKVVLRIFPIWSSSVLFTTPITIQSTLTILQVLTMDRHLGPHFQIPAGSILVIATIATLLSLAFIDRLLWPAYKRLTHLDPTPLQRIAAGYVFNIASVVVSALVESKRLKISRAHPGTTVPMSVLWLFPQLILSGTGEAFHLPGQFTFYFQEFPLILRGTSTAMVALVIGISYYLSTASIDLIRSVTSWLPNDINKGRVDKVCWALVVAMVLNLGYFLVCSKFYKYQKHEKDVLDGEEQEADGHSFLL